MTETRQVKGCCPLRHARSRRNCLGSPADKVVRVEGARQHPFTRGVLCAKVRDYEQRTYAADRLLSPLRRTGAKGAGHFTRITWDEALETIAVRFTDIIAAHGAEALMPLHSLGSLGVVQRRALLRLFHALGATRVHGSLCGAAGNVLAAEGHPRGFDPEDLVHSRLILLWGANLLTTGHHHWHFVQEARRHGARLVCLDSRRTRTADACDAHVPLRPGSDTALAAGMLRYLFEEGYADLAFARRRFAAALPRSRPCTAKRLCAACPPWRSWAATGSSQVVGCSSRRIRCSTTSARHAPTSRLDSRAASTWPAWVSTSPGRPSPRRSRV